MSRHVGQRLGTQEVGPELHCFRQPTIHLAAQGDLQVAARGEALQRGRQAEVIQQTRTQVFDNAAFQLDRCHQGHACAVKTLRNVRVFGAQFVGRARDVHPLMYTTAAAFLAYFIFGGG